MEQPTSAELKAHLRSCAACQEFAAEWRAAALDEELRLALAVEPSHEFLAQVRMRVDREAAERSGRRFGWLVAAPAVVAAVVAAVIALGAISLVVLRSLTSVPRGDALPSQAASASFPTPAPEWAEVAAGDRAQRALDSTAAQVGARSALRPAPRGASRRTAADPAGGPGEGPLPETIVAVGQEAAVGRFIDVVKGWNVKEDVVMWAQPDDAVIGGPRMDPPWPAVVERVREVESARNDWVAREPAIWSN